MSTAHSETSRNTAKVSRHLCKKLILTFLEESPQGATSFEIEDFFRWPHQTVSAVLSKAEVEALVCRNGSKRLSPQGYESFVYFAPAYVPADKRKPVVRKGETVVSWTN